MMFEDDGLSGPALDILFLHNFTAPDGTLVTDVSPDIGSIVTGVYSSQNQNGLSPGVPNQRIANNRLQRRYAGVDYSFSPMWNATKVACTSEIKISRGAARLNFSILIRADVNGGTFGLRITYDSLSGNFTLFEYVTLRSTVASVFNSGDVVKIIDTGTLVSVYRNDAFIFSYSTTRNNTYASMGAQIAGGGVGTDEHGIDSIKIYSNL